VSVERIRQHNGGYGGFGGHDRGYGGFGGHNGY
jgi:hypothetical protein